MRSVIVIARKELVDLRRDRVVVTLLACLAVAIIVSVVVASLDFRAQLSEYHAYLAQIRASGSGITPAEPRLFPLQLLRGGMEYVEIVGALFAVVLGYSTIAAERRRGTLHLLLTREIGRAGFALGKLAGIAVFWAVVLVALVAVSTATVAVVGTAHFALGDAVRIGIAGVFGWIYLIFWSALAMAVTARATRPGSALLILLAIWLVFVLIIPQIGDTMDPDNQVPGGMFAALQIQKPDEQAVLAHFTQYESARNGLEVSSVSKLFERISFAFLGVKEQYNQQPLALIWAAMLHYAVGLIAATALAVGLALGGATRRNLLRKAS